MDARPDPENDANERAAGSARLTPAQLLEEVDHAAGAGHGGALLVVALNRSDRLGALAQQASARIALAEVSRRIAAILRPCDRYAIAAHDEAWVWIPGLSGSGLAEIAARTIRQSLERPMPIEHGERSTPAVQMRPIVGGAFCAHAPRGNPMALLRAASEACARARRRDDPLLLLPIEAATDPVDRSRVETELRAAVHAGELDVFFQPQVDLAARRCTGAEALVRWVREDGTQVDPALLSSVAEECGLMDRITQFVLNAALRHQTNWRARGVDVGVSINVSPVLLSDPGYPQQIGQALATWGTEPSRLTLEITESLLVRNEDTALQVMTGLRAIGCRLALDDFGTGYSSFAYLRRFPLDELKIDRSFIDAITEEGGDTRIVRSLVDLAHTFDLVALAEGVEDERSAGIVSALGCDLAQGYHFARPLPPADFPDWCLAFNGRTATERAGAAR